MTTWSDERVEMLKHRFQAGESFAAIARALGSGVSRSACIGKATRMGLERSCDGREFHRVASKVATSHAQGRDKGRDRDWERRPRAPLVARAPAQNNGLNFHGPRIRSAGLTALAGFQGAGEEPGESGVRMAQVERGHCRWPFGDPETSAFRFCGAPKTKGAYCAAHAARAYLPPPEGESGEMFARLFGWLK